MKRNPILMVRDAGFGETPVPADALFQPGEEVEFGRTDHDDMSMSSVVLAVVPAGQFPEYAMADQATPKRPRPLTLSVSAPKSETSYVIQFAFRDSPTDDGIRLYTQSTMLAGQRLAEERAGR